MLSAVAPEAIVLDFIFSPVTFFERRLRRPPNWPLALLPLGLCVIVQIASALLFVEKMQPVLAGFEGRSAYAAWATPFQVFSVVLVAFGYAATYAMAALALVCLDVVTTDSRRGARLAEFVGLSFFTQVPYAIVTVLIAYFWSPAESGLGSGTSLEHVSQAVDRQHAAITASPLLSTGRLLSYYSTVWLVVLLSAALKAVTGLGTKAAWLAALFLLAVFVGIRLLGRAAGV